MKKILTGLLSAAMTVSMATTVALAANSQTKVKPSLNKVVGYYTKNNTLSSSDQVISVASLGLDASSKSFKLDPDYKKSLASLSTKSIGEFTKGIVAITLLGDNPASYQGKNYVKSLEGLVAKDGSIKGTTGPNQSVYALYALESVNSSKVSVAAKYLASQAMDNGAFWYNYNGKFADDATTAWVIEALTLANKKTYAPVINKAFAYLEGGYKQDGSYDNSGFGGNADTQSCVLQAYAVYNKKAMKTKAVDYLLSKQLDDGSFSALNYTTGKEESNAYTTVEAARALGTYTYGSVYQQAAAFNASYHKLTKDNVKLSKTTYVYNGKRQQPTVKVTYDKKALNKKNYVVTLPKEAKKVSKYTITVKGKGDYKGIVKVTYTITPAAVKVKSVKGVKKGFVVSYQKAPKTTVQVAYTLGKKTTYKKTTQSVLKVSALKAGKTYGVKVRALQNGVYGPWSKSVQVKA